MKLIDMKMPKRTKKDHEEAMIAPNEERYPYGLRLSFGKESIEKMETLKSIQAGAMVDIVGVGKVTEVRITDAENDRKRHNIEIQIQKVDVVERKKPEKMSASEYKKWRT